MRKLIITIAIMLSAGLQSENNEMVLSTNRAPKVILDRETKEPLAAVRVETKNKIFYSNLDGVIDKAALKDDTISLSLISYKPMKIITNDSINVFYMERI